MTKQIEVNEVELKAYAQLEVFTKSQALSDQAMQDFLVFSIGAYGDTGTVKHLNAAINATKKNYTNRKWVAKYITTYCDARKVKGKPVFTKPDSKKNSVATKCKTKWYTGMHQEIANRAKAKETANMDSFKQFASYSTRLSSHIESGNVANMEQAMYMLMLTKEVELKMVEFLNAQ